MSRKVVLSKRLSALADMVTPGNRVCDVGCDHGFLSIYLVQKRLSPAVVAMDVRSGPLSRAKEHIFEYGLEQYIETRLSDGLEALTIGETQSLVCAGMGGKLMSRILSQGRPLAQSFQELILQPQSELPLFRKFLREEGYRTVEENMIEEEGKFYFLIKAVPSGRTIVCEEPLYDLFGKDLLEKKHPILQRYLEYRLKEAQGLSESLSGRNTNSAKTRLLELQEDIRYLLLALNWRN